MIVVVVAFRTNFFLLHTTKNKFIKEYVSLGLYELLYTGVMSLTTDLGAKINNNNNKHIIVKLVFLH